MANEITVTTSLRWSKGGAAISGTASNTYDQVGEQAIESVQIIGATSEAINLGDVVTVGYMLFKNLNASGGATIHISTLNPAVAGTTNYSLTPGDAVSVIGVQTAWWAISSTGSSNLLVIAIET